MVTIAVKSRDLRDFDKDLDKEREKEKDKDKDKDKEGERRDRRKKLLTFDALRSNHISRSKSHTEADFRTAMSSEEPTTPPPASPPLNLVTMKKSSTSRWSIARKSMDLLVDPAFNLDFLPGERLFYKGYVRLKKEGKFMATVKESRRYWMVLKGTDLLLFKDHKKKEGDPPKKIELPGSSLENFTDDLQRAHFRLTLKASESYLIECENEDDKIAWMEYLEEAGAEHRDPDGVFGIPLEVIQRVNDIGVPLVAIACMACVERFGINQVGIYRLSASKTKIDDLRKVLAAGHYQDIETVERWDVNTVSCVFKQWLRELPNPLCTFERYAQLVDLATGPSILGFKGIMVKLPFNHRILLQQVLQHLSRLTNHAASNKMTAGSLGAIFGPSILRPGPDQSFQILKQNAAIEFMIEHVEDIF